MEKNKEETSKIGEGAYGIVYRVLIDGEDKESKVMKRNITEQSTSFSSSVRELDILMVCKGHPNIVTLEKVLFGNNNLSALSPLNKENYKDDTIHFVFENLPMDLATYISTQEITISVIKNFMKDIFTGLEYLHRLGYLHRDIKPGNLLVSNANDIIPRHHIKLCDFGLSMPFSKNEKLSSRMVTGWYRSPDICLGNRGYQEDIDIWSSGCVMYELLTKTPMCDKCDDETVCLLGTIFKHIPKDCFIGLDPKMEIPDTVKERGISKEEFLEKTKCPSEIRESFYSLFVGLMKVNPKERLKIGAILNHKFFADIKDKSDIYRKKYLDGIHNRLDDQYHIIKCPEREWIFSLAFDIFNHREDIEWYSHRVLFQALSIIERYLYWKSQNSGNTKGSEGRFHSKHGTVLRFLICIYMAVKYFTAAEVVTPFEKFVVPDYTTSESIVFAEAFEKELIKDILSCKIFSLNPYEVNSIYKELSDSDIKKILMGYSELSRGNKVKDFKKLL